MPPQHKAGHEGLGLGRAKEAGLKELTIQLGDSDVYVNMARKVEMDNGHTLFEAILTDASGSRAIYIDRDEILECLREEFIQGAPPAPEAPVDDKKIFRGGS